MFGSSLPPVVCRRAHVLLTMFGSSLPPVVCRRAHVLLTMFGSVQPCMVFTKGKQLLLLMIHTPCFTFSQDLLLHVSHLVKTCYSMFHI
jgi:hypothetical protein